MLILIVFFSLWGYFPIYDFLNPSQGCMLFLYPISNCFFVTLKAIIIFNRRQHPMYYSPHFIDRDTKFQLITRICDDSRILGKQQLMEEHGWVQTLFWWTSWVPVYAEHFNYLSEVLNNGSTCNDKVFLVHIPGPDFIDAFFGCLKAKFLSVPVLPLDPL